MLVSMRRAIVLVFMVLALLAGLIGWSVRMATLPTMQYHTGVHATHTLADGSPNWYCPPPPKIC